MSNIKPSKEQKVSDESLKKNLDGVFKYARMFVVNKSENEEEELMAIILLKKQILERLFPPTNK